MATRPTIARTVPALRRALAKADRGDIALVPTMGALHDGHIALVRRARRLARRVVVSIFVNPTQFAPSEDLGTYPRTWAADIARLTAEKVSLVWAPAAGVMYPDGFATRVDPAGAATAGLEDKFRPHFFGGVATVCTKLFTQVEPGFALFGEKDYQQLRVITQAVRDLDLPLKIVPVPTVREKDGLALSSRNVYLSAAERAAAPVLYRTLKSSASRIKAGEPIAKVLADGANHITRAGFALDYLETRNARTLDPVTSLKDGPLRLLVAAKIGTTRLIDNVAV
jgi:pantoate--beta-alanine ligase